MRPTYIGDVKAWVSNLDAFAQDKKCPAPVFLKPFHFVLLGLQLCRLGVGVRLPDELCRYAARMHLWQAIRHEPPVQVQEGGAGGRFFPLQRLDSRADVPDSANQLAAIARTYGADPETENSLGISLHEIMENCFAHGEVGVDLVGLACAQSWPKGGKAQIAIGDMGIGIRRSLAQNPDLHARLDVENSCTLASELGITSKPGKGHAGYGLAFTRQLLERNGGSLLVVSHGEWLNVHGPHVAEGAMGIPWPGTLVVVEWNTDSPLRARDVYDSWPLPEGFSDDDFDF